MAGQLSAADNAGTSLPVAIPRANSGPGWAKRRTQWRRQTPHWRRIKWRMGALAGVAVLYFAASVAVDMYYAQPEAADGPAEAAGASLEASAPTHLAGPLPLSEHDAATVAGGRQLMSTGTTDCDTSTGAGIVILYFVGILYLFVGLAIVCDEWFVPSLEVISEKLDLTEDVAGATFMAAGSSAPELFTSVGDAFGPKNSIGIGTIVGSAMFNILVIVALASAAAGQKLKIDWRPLVRDASFYTISLLMMVLFILTPERGKVEWYEGLIMVIGYLCYVLWMRFNSRIFAKCAPAVEDGKPGSYKLGQVHQIEPATLSQIKTNVAERRASQSSANGAEATPGAILTPTNKGTGATPTMAVGVSKQSMDLGGTEGIDEAILEAHRRDQEELDNMSPTSRAKAVAEGRGKRGSVEIQPRHMRRGSKKWVANKRASITEMESKDLAAQAIAELANEEEGQAAPVSGTAVAPTPATGADGRVKAFAEAPKSKSGPSSVGGSPGSSNKVVPTTPGGHEVAASEGAEKAAAGGEDDEDERGRFEYPKGEGLFDQLLFIMSLPWLVLFHYTVPDCNKDRWQKYYLAAFFISILWIGGICWGMVEFASEAGCILEIAPPVMGIVVLAVGTSVPDAMASMIVAREGEADMAIANAVGSNVFDILLGLGIPWFLVGLIDGEPTPVNVDGIEIGIIILFGTVAVFVGTIVVNKFHMTSTVGWIFLAVYIMYITVTMLMEFCVLKVTDACNA